MSIKEKAEYAAMRNRMFEELTSIELSLKDLEELKKQSTSTTDTNFNKIGILPMVLLVSIFSLSLFLISYEREYTDNEGHVITCSPVMFAMYFNDIDTGSNIDSVKSDIQEARLQSSIIFLIIICMFIWLFYLVIKK